MDYHQFDSDFGHSNSSTASMANYTAKTFGWMFVGLMLTFVTGALVVFSPLAPLLFTSQALSLGLGIAQIAVVMFLSFRINKISAGTATGLFLAYSVLTGLTFSGLFISYGFGRVIGVFLLTALYFGALAAFGYMTKTDLSKLGPFLVGGLIFVVIAGFLMMLIPGLAFMERALCLAGIVIFLGMTAYDTQKIRAQYFAYQGNEAMLAKASIISALTLYLDFINLFIYLLRFLGSNRD